MQAFWFDAASPIALVVMCSKLPASKQAEQSRQAGCVHIIQIFSTKIGNNLFVSSWCTTAAGMCKTVQGIDNQPTYNKLCKEGGVVGGWTNLLPFQKGEQDKEQKHWKLEDKKKRTKQKNAHFQLNLCTGVCVLYILLVA